jgi:Ca-activated chloride channel family protein
MKKTNAQFEKNIARLVKLAGDSQSPSDRFTETLIDAALRELPQAQSGRQRSTPMKSTTKTLIKIAAVVFNVIGLAVVFPKPPLRKAHQHAYVAVENSDRKEGLLTENLGSSKTNLSLVTTRREPSPPATLQHFARLGVNGTVIPAEAEAPARPAMYQYKLSESLVLSDEASRMAHGGTTPPNGEPVDAMFFKNYGVNPFIDTEDDHLSTFAIDVDSGSYTLSRSYLLQGNLPPRDAVRVEEFVNYFDYNYPAPQRDTFAVFCEAMPWSFGPERQNTYLMRIGLKALEVPDELRKPAVLTFVIDVSGSMSREDRLGLVKQSLRLLIDKLRPDDKIGIAVYGSRGHAVLEHTTLAHRDAIIEAIDALRSEGSTYAEEGIRIGYDMAQAAFTPGHINRVILCSDGVANVGQTGADHILQIIREKADNGITLSALGFGMGNYNDVLMEQLGNKGNGYYAYIDTLDQARRLFSNLTGALQVVARDVKIQVDFNPDVVRSYRLIGYENRDVADKDFRNDTVDGGEIGAGHATTALYELKLWPEKSGKIATTFIRYKDADTFKVTEISSAFNSGQIAGSTDVISDAFALSSVVTEFAEILRESYWAKGADLSATLARAELIAENNPADIDIAELKDLIARAVELLKNKQKTPPEETPDPDLAPADIEYIQ